MPKRSIDATASPSEAPVTRVMRKTERSHEENQERAYIAASRRADRSIEARVQSAKMASEIHKKRTGKSFKISEEIVIKEEMYEEEDDDLPRQYRQLAAHLQTSSPEMNHRLSAYLTNSVAMASLARQREVDRMFAEAYPNANKVSQQMSDSMYFKPLQAQNQSSNAGDQSQLTSPTSPQFAPMLFGKDQANDFVRERSDSVSAATTSAALSPQSTTAQSPVMSRASVDGPKARPIKSLSSKHSAKNTPKMMNLPTFDFTSTNPGQIVDPTATTMPSQNTSIFTSELPNGIKQLANLDMNDPMTSAFLGGGNSGNFGLNNGLLSDISWGNFSSMGVPPGSQGTETTPTFNKGFTTQTSFDDNYFDAGMHMPTRGVGGEASGNATPNWDSFLNSDWSGAA